MSTRGLKRKVSGNPFATRRNPKNHTNYCYFCDTKIKGLLAKNKYKTKHSNLHLAIQLVFHTDESTIPKPSDNFTNNDATEEIKIDEVKLPLHPI